MSKSMAREMSQAFALTTKPEETNIEEAFLAGAAYALQEAANDLLSDPTALPDSAKAVYNKVYALWLRERAVHIGDD